MGGSTKYLGWKPSKWHVKENIINNIHGKLTKLYDNNIINKTPDDKQETGVNDTGSTVYYLKYDMPHHPSTNMWPSINVGFANVQTMQ